MEEFNTKIDLVCEGGGVKGIGLLGAICCLEEKGYTFERIAGTSAGAIASAFLAVGYTGNEMKEILFNLELKSLLDRNIISYLPIIGENFNLLMKKGIFSGNAIEKYLKSKFAKKNKTKFKDISINGVSPLKIIATDVTKRQLLILPDDLINYNIDPMEFEISKAVRMSISLPFYFNPVILNYGKDSSYIVDGGVLSNYPIWLFDTNSKPRWPTFGLKLVSNKDLTFTSPNKSTVLSYSIDIIDTLLSKDEEIYINNKDLIRTINIPTFNIKTTDFLISKNDMERLFNSGYNAANQFLKTWNFEKYISKYRSSSA